MSYQVLARKWRPKNFQALIGQEHVVNVLANALSQNRLHHAYLFTGTRGVGKTTIARIFAKSLNCQQGITNTPCGKCDACIDIDQGRFVDLLEIDAASKTKVDDTREILDNVQYAPSSGRFKVYLIDEVHMLSRHSFNALLKTLEEPPEHVKFILATTDPQKLPITVLSRCLQFHLKALTVKQIEHKLVEILTAEKVNYEKGSLTSLAKAARGSMRDSLSLTDQAIAQGQGSITLSNVQQMLGGIDQNWVYQLVIALLKQDSKGLMALSQQIASYAPSYSRLFAELIQLFHQIALYQIVEQNFDLSSDLLSLLRKFSATLSAEDVQLYYQISLNGRKDLPYAHDEQAAFDMTLLRLLAFKPMVKATVPIHQPTIDNTSVSSSFVADAEMEQANKTIESDMPLAEVNVLDSIDVVKSVDINDKFVANAASNGVNTVSEHNIEMTKVNNSPTDVTSLITTSQTVSDHAYDHFNPKSGLNNNEISTEQELLNEQLLAIEQQAVVLSHSDDTSQIVESSALTDNLTPSVEVSLVDTAQTQNNVVDQANTNQPEQVPNAESSVSSVLATRNMLRSRKKVLEKPVKKPHDANLRHSSSVEKITNSHDIDPLQPKVAITTEQLNNNQQVPVNLPQPQSPFNHDAIDPKVVTKANQVDKWAHMIDSMQLTARIRQLAIHATISEESTDDHLILKLDQATRHLSTDAAHHQLGQRISEFLSRQVKVSLDIVDETVADPYQIQSHINDKRLEYAKSIINEDNTVIALQNTFQATIDESSILPR